MSTSRYSALVLNDTSVDRHHGCTRVMSGLASLLRNAGIEVCYCSPAHTDWRKDTQVLTALEQVDIVIVNGEGTLHHGCQQGNILLEIADAAKSFKTPSALVNALWQDNGPDQVGKLSKFDLVYVRDSYSAKDLSSSGIPCGYTPDLSFYDSYLQERTNTSGLGFTDSVLHEQTLRLEAARSVFQGSIIPIQASGKGSLAYFKFLKSRLMRSDLLQPAKLPERLALWSRYYRAQLPSPTHMLRAIEKQTLLVTGRFHACTAALITETPFLALPSNSLKIEALISDVGLEEWRVDDSVLNYGLDNAKRFAWNPGELQRIRAYKASGVDQFNKLSRDLAGLL